MQGSTYRTDDDVIFSPDPRVFWFSVDFDARIRDVSQHIYSGWEGNVWKGENDVSHWSIKNVGECTESMKEE